MKFTIQEIRTAVRRLLKEALTNKCTKCGYDNPYMDPVDDYVCRQCRQHAEVFGGKDQKPGYHEEWEKIDSQRDLHWDDLMKEFPEAARGWEQRSWSTRGRNEDDIFRVLDGELWGGDWQGYEYDWSPNDGRWFRRRM